MTDKKSSAIVFMLTANYHFALATMIINLQERNRHNYDNIVVYHDGLTANQQSDLLSIEPNILFISYTFSDWKKEHHEETMDGKQLDYFIKRFSHFALSKYKVVEQLAHYHKVLFLDLDMVVQDDLSELFKIEGVAWRSESPFLKKFGDRTSRPPLAELNNIPHTHPAPNGGLFYADDTLDWQQAVKDAQFFLKTFLGYFSSVIDELAFSWLAYKQNINITELDYKIYNTLPRVATHQTKIVHFMGNMKPWNCELSQSAFPTWMRNYQKTLTFGDFSSDKITHFGETGELLRKRTNEAHWLHFLQHSKLEIPTNLKLRYELDKDELTLDYKPFIYYEFVLQRNTWDFKLTLQINIKEITRDKRLKNVLNAIVTDNENLTYLENSKGITLTAKRCHLDKINSYFCYFYQKTQPILEILG
ncbi:glycosyltransferase [Testudinibacter sp. P80/BLE/0925]|uniref:glycosyltransferase n=1 Tax=Testudinibacter sp. TW-1 TaxID=3417757 RepID=UPI003D36985F